jgi:hypothetical protein
VPGIATVETKDRNVLVGEACTGGGARLVGAIRTVAEVVIYAREWNLDGGVGEAGKRL